MGTMPPAVRYDNHMYDNTTGSGAVKQDYDQHRIQFDAINDTNLQIKQNP